MSQWGQAQPGYQYPLQTGFQPANTQFQQQNPQFQQQNPQFQPQNLSLQQPGGFGAGGLISQPTGFAGQRLQGFQQPQQPGFQGSGFIQTQPTGFPQQGPNFQVRQPPPPPPPPPVPPIPTQFQRLNQGPSIGLPQQQAVPASRFMGSSPAIAGPGLAQQPTGFVGRSGISPLVAQPTGFVDPRLQMMTNTFMPLNASSFGPGVVPQVAPPQYDLQQSFQQHNQVQRGATTPQMSWALTKAEKKQYNDLFRSWDAQGTGFISGQTALEVFGVSGLPKDDLARIWTLADIDDRGKLNMAEFHVAMGLIYRRLSGMPVPDKLPSELVPPSARDLDNSVDIVKDLLRYESRTSGADTPVSRLKNRSFNTTGSALDSGRDATIYKHSDSEPPGGFYQPRSRHVNRDDVRSGNDSDSPSADLSDLKRRLANTAQMLERTAEADTSRTAEDEELDREMDDLKYRVKRVSDDLEYVSRGPKTAAKDQERRQLERELLTLMHEKVPEVERKMKARDERKEREKRQWARDRDRANDRFGRYDDRDRDRPYSRGSFDRDRPYSRGAYDRDDRDRPYSRGAFDRDERDRDRERDRDDKDYGRDSYRRERSHSRDRPRSSSAPRTAPRPPSAAPPSSTRNHPAPPPPKPSPSPSPLKNMTPEERRAYAREEAKRLIESRKVALGVTVPSSSSPTIDTSVEDRLQREKKEAEEKARVADQQAQERERIRNQRLESEKAAREIKTPPPVPTPTRTVPAATAPAPVPTPRTAPVAPKRAPAPPPPRKAPAIRTPVSAAAPAPKPPVIAAPPPEPEIDPEEEALRAREEAIRKQREARAERLRQLEREEEEAARKDVEERRQARIREERAEKLRQMKKAEEEEQLEEQKYQERLIALKAKSAPSPAFSAPAESAAPLPAKAPTPPPAVPQPPKAETPAPDTAKSTNPFSRLIGQGATSSPAASPVTTSANGSTNPWARPQTAPPSSVPNPPKSPVPAAIKTSYHTAPSSIDEDWDDIKENEGDESSDDDFSGRTKRENIARQLFGSIIPTSRPQSAADVKTRASPTSPAQSAVPPPPPSAPPAMNAPPPPAAPPPPVLAPVAASSEDRSGLLSSIQAGLKLRPAKTVDKSGPPVSGRVLGDTAPPSHINTAPRPVSPPSQARQPEPTLLGHDSPGSRSGNRQSMSWFADRAADAGSEVHKMPTTHEEDEGEAAPVSIPAIHVDEHVQDGVPDLMADIDKTTTHRVRTLYPFAGDGPDDLSFSENLIITANPSKSGGDWWYGTLVSNGKSGVFPRTFVEVVKPTKAKALYSYTAGGSDEVPFTEGDELTIIDMSEEEWWKTEQGGMVFIVPAAYLETVEGATAVGINPSKTADKMTPGNLDADPSLSDGSRTSESLRYQDTRSNILGESGDEDSDTDSDSSDYLSFDEDDYENVNPETKAEREARAHERQLVLEAAGLIVTQHDKLPAAVVRARSQKRRPAPVAPRKGKFQNVVSPVKELPPVPQVVAEPEPETPTDLAQCLDDAFDRYESFKNTQLMSNRMSVASTISAEVVFPPSPTPSTTASRERDGEGRSYSYILNFLGRSRTPEEKERNTNKLNISAPIMQGSGDSDPGLAASPVFGTSWASLVDKTALEGIPSGERRRQEAIFELVNTESAYVRDLQLIVEVFYSTMMPLLSQKEVTVVFANVEDLLLVNTAFVSSLEGRQKECRLYVDNVGDILLTHIPNMAGYMEYCVNHGTAIKVLKSLRDSNPDLASHLQHLRDDPTVRNLDLSSYLLVPMQRITRYPLLIKQILAHTDAQDERKNVQHALEMSEKLLDNINEAIRDQEGRETLKSISQNLWIGQGRLDLTAPTRHMGPRKLIKQGPLTKAKSGRKLYGFLCSDILVLTDASMKTLYKMPIPLAHAQVNEAHPGRDGLTFLVCQAYPRGGDSIALKASSVRDCQMWTHEIEYASRRCRHAEDRAVRKGKK